jgi:hypothetical protein
VHDVLADETGTELREVLGELDAELRRQEEEIRARRLRLAELLRQAEDGTLPADAPLSPELTSLFARAAGRGDTGDSGDAEDTRGPEPAILAKDREVLALLETSARPGARETVLAMADALTADEGAAGSVRHTYALLEELAEAPADDPRVEDAAHAVAACVPDETVRNLATTPVESSGGLMPEAFAQALYADLAPAQAETVRRAMTLLIERGHALAPTREERR